MKPATACTWIKWQTATASIYILQINKKVSRLALGHMPASYLMGTAKAEDEYISTLHMPPWCGQGNLTFTLTAGQTMAIKILRLIMITYLR